jgi:hypothetical protein
VPTVLTLFGIQADTSEPFVRYIRSEWHTPARRQPCYALRGVFIDNFHTVTLSGLGFAAN